MGCLCHHIGAHRRGLIEEYQKKVLRAKKLHERIVGMSKQVKMKKKCPVFECLCPILEGALAEAPVLNVLYVSYINAYPNTMIALTQHILLCSLVNSSLIIC